MLAPSATTTRSGRSPNPIWPLAVPFLGLPIWWLLGVWQIMFFVMAIPMFIYLVKQRTIVMPRGFSLWLLWMAWLFTGLLVIQVDAPGTVPGVSMNRYLTFAFRYGWYLIATIVALYIVNTRRVLSTQKIVQAVAWFFVALVVGGLLGLLAPNISFPSLLQMALPHGLANHSFVNQMTHVQTAQMHTILGSPQPRPSAPFIYTNSWGFAFAITLPLFVVAWWLRGKAWRVATVIVLLLAVFPLVFSLNRGTWLAILAAVALAAVQMAMRGHVRVLVITMLLAVLAAVTLLVSPLGDLVLGRFEHGHSDAVRGNLATTAIESTLQGSPVLGFGTTRDVAGNFSSIAGGASAACPNCEPPPVGTHGQIWMVMFGAGFVGMALYLSFLASQFLRNWRVRSPYALAALASLLVMIVALPLYNAIGISLYMGFIAIGLLGRESGLPLPSLQEAIQPVRRQAPLIAVFAVVGAVAGLAVHLVLGAPVSATQRVLVPSAELVAVPGARTSTLDAEALIAASESVVSAVADETGESPGKVRESLTIGAEPNTRVMLITYQSETQERAQLGVETAVSAYLEQRERLLNGIASDVRSRYGTRQAQLDEIYRTTRPLAVESQSGQLWSTLSEINRQWARASGMLLEIEEVSPARPVSEVRLRESETEQTVRISSGFALGALIALPIAFLWDQRSSRVRNKPRRTAGISVPVVARLSETDRRGASRVVAAYSPLAGVVADPGSLRARRLAAEVDGDRQLSRYAGSRVLVIIESGSRAGRVKAMLRRFRHSGLDPVGLVYAKADGDERE